MGELGKLGIEVAKSTVEKYRVRSSKPPSPTWRAFLTNHVTDLVSIDFFTVPTVNFKVIFVLIVLAHDRRRVVHFNVTENPTDQWAAQQIIEAFPWDSAPKYLLRDRDAIFADAFRRRVESLGIAQVLSAPRSPWQNPYVERLIGTLRRDCLDHVIVLNANHARRILASYLRYYHRWRTHLSLAMDAPDPRAVHPPDQGGCCRISGGRRFASPLRTDGGITAKLTQSDTRLKYEFSGTTAGEVVYVGRSDNILRPVTHHPAPFDSFHCVPGTGCAQEHLAQLYIAAFKPVENTYVGVKSRESMTQTAGNDTTSRLDLL